MTEQKYTPTEAARLRDKLIRDKIVPNVRRAFEAHPALQSATLLVAQYRCDDANAAVRCDLVFLELDKPDTESAYLSRRRRFEDDGLLAVRSAAGESGWTRWFPWLAKQAPQVIAAQNSSRAVALNGDPTNLPSGIDEATLEREIAWNVGWRGVFALRHFAAPEQRRDN